MVGAETGAIGSAAEGLDLITLGRRVRHLRKAKGLTLDEVSALVGRAPSQLSMIENGRREPRLSVLQALAGALDVTLDDLLATGPPSRRAALEISLERAQRGPLYRGLGLPAVRAGSNLGTDVLESLVGLHEELTRRATEQLATPEEARRANAELRREMRERDNYFGEIDAAAQDLLDEVGHTGGPLSQRVIADLARRLGYGLHRVPDLPPSTRSVIDHRNRRIYVQAAGPVDGHGARRVVLQALGTIVLQHRAPSGYAEFLRQRVETNYFAAALLMPERSTVHALLEAKHARALDIEDLRDQFAVSHETAAHRFTNLCTRHLGLPVHFMRVHQNGTIYKAYENDGVNFPTDVTGAIEGQPCCRFWTVRAVFDQPDATVAYSQYTDTPSGTYWCTAHVEDASTGRYSVAVGVPYAHVKWFRGRETTQRSASRCPDESCCRRPPPDLSGRWGRYATPSARVHSHLLAALPPGTYPGVDESEVYAFLDAHAPD